jgi:hypothetical protein
VADVESQRVVMVIGVHRHMHARLVEISNAFVRADLPAKHQNMYMWLVGADGKRQLVRLLKPLYGMKQSAYLWFHKLRKSLLVLGFATLQSDP